MTRTLSLTEVKTQFPRLVAGVQHRAERVVVTKNGKPAAILVNYEDYDSLMETLEILGDPALMRQIKRNLRYFDRGGKGYSIDEVFGPGK